MSKKKQYGMVIDTTRCVGCQTCVVTCKISNQTPKDVYWGKMETIGSEIMYKPSGKFPNPRMAFRPRLCNHCEDPACVANCPTGAMHKKDNGIVEVNQDVCIGCQYCVWTCPYNAPVFDPIKRVMSKCDLCEGRLEKGEVPYCVEACPAEARIFGIISDPSSEISVEKIINQFISDESLPSDFSDLFDKQLIPYSIKKFEKGEIIFRPDELHKYSYYVKKGIVKINMLNREGKEKVLFFHKTGSIFGFQNIQGDKLTVTTASALIRCELYQFEFDYFYQFVQNNQRYFSVLLRYIFEMMVLQSAEVVNLSYYTTLERLSALLAVLAKEYGGSATADILIPFNNDELSAMIGASRNSVSNAIAILSHKRIISKKRNTVIIHDLRRLEELASL